MLALNGAIEAIMSLPLLAPLAILLYLASAALLILRLSRGVQDLASKTGIIALGFGAFILHAGILQQHLLIQNGINLGFFDASSLIGWLIAGLLLLAAIRRPVENLGIVLLPLAAATIIMERLFSSHHVVQILGSWQLQVHILLSVLAYSVLTIAMVQAVLLAVQDRQLRNRQPGGFVAALPPLATMEALLFQMIGLGFALLTLSLVTGVLFLEDIFAQHLVHKTVLSIVAWVVFAILVQGRWRFGWRGRTAIRWTLGGFIVLMLAYFGTKLVLELLLGR